jgi:hypothetical protein
MDGAVTLTGHVSTYSEKLAAAEAAERVYGVKAVANDLEVRLTDTRDDSDIAKAIAHVLDSNTNIPTGQVRARVEHGWVTLEGAVDYSYQRDEVERMVRHVRGVVGVFNNIEVKPPVSPVEVETRIAEAFVAAPRWTPEGFGSKCPIIPLISTDTSTHSESLKLRGPRPPQRLG